MVSIEQYIFEFQMRGLLMASCFSVLRMKSRCGVGSPPTKFMFVASFFVCCMIVASCVGEKLYPVCVWLISWFWQKRQVKLHPLKKMVYEGMRNDSSPW